MLLLSTDDQQFCIDVKCFFVSSSKILFMWEISGMMNALLSFVLLACYGIAIIAAIESDHDKEVEIIAGSDIPQPSPLDAKFAGQAYPNDIYGPQVRHWLNSVR